MKRAYAIGFEMGGTNFRCGAVSPRGEVLLAIRGPSRAMDHADLVLANIAGRVREVEKAARARGWGAPMAVGVAVPGPIDLGRGVVMAAPHVGAWRRYPLRARLEAELKRSVTLENDANAWTLGESWIGAGRGLADMILLTLGTGVGGGIIVAGRIVHGKLGMAGEMGHITLDPDGPPCDCGSRGCLEAYASSSGLRRFVARRLKIRHRTAMPRAFLDQYGNFAVAGLAAAARGGNPVAIAAFRTAGRFLGIAIAGLINTFNPEMVVIGGGVAGAMPLMRAEMNRELHARAIAFALDRTPVVRARLGDRAGVIGAARAAFDAVRKHP